MIKASYVGKKLSFYLDKQTMAEAVNKYGNFTRAYVGAQDGEIALRPNIEGTYVVKEVPSAPGARTIVSLSGGWNLPQFGRIAIEKYDVLADGIYFKLPDGLPAPTIRKQKKRKAAKATAVDVIRDLEELRNPQVIEAIVDADAQIVILYEGREFRFNTTPASALKLVMDHTV